MLRIKITGCPPGDEHPWLHRQAWVDTPPMQAQYSLESRQVFEVPFEEGLRALASAGRDGAHTYWYVQCPRTFSFPARCCQIVES